MEGTIQENQRKMRNSWQSVRPVSVCIHVLRPARSDYRALRSATTLVEAGFSVNIVDVEADTSLPTEESFQGIQIKHLIIPGWYTARGFEPAFFVKALWTFILSVILLLRTKADVYHANDLTALPAACVAALLRHTFLIFEIYDLQFPKPETGVGFWYRCGALLTAFQAMVLPHCEAVIATSPFHIREICNYFKVKKIVLLRNIPPYRLVEKTNRLRESLGLAPETRIVLYQGGLQPGRGLDHLIRAAHFLEKNTVIVIRGKDVLGTEAQLKSLIASEKVTDRVMIIPLVSYEESFTWTASADLGLILHSPGFSLNTRYLLPNKLFEYLMAGLPVLTSPLEAVVEVITMYDVGQVVSSLTPEDIAHAINTMLADPVKLASMRENALRAAREEFNWEKERWQLIQLYESIVHKAVRR